MRLLVQFLEQRPRLSFRHMLKCPLQNTAPVRMGSETISLSQERPGDELAVFGPEPLEAALQDVVGVLVLGALHHFAFEFGHDRALLVRRDEFERLWASTRSAVSSRTGRGKLRSRPG